MDLIPGMRTEHSDVKNQSDHTSRREVRLPVASCDGRPRLAPYDEPNESEVSGRNTCLSGIPGSYCYNITTFIARSEEYETRRSKGNVAAWLLSRRSSNSTQINWGAECAYGVMKERPNEKKKKIQEFSSLGFRNRFSQSAVLGSGSWINSSLKRKPVPIDRSCSNTERSLQLNTLLA